MYTYMNMAQVIMEAEEVSPSAVCEMQSQERRGVAEAETEDLETSRDYCVNPRKEL